MPSRTRRAATRGSAAAAAPARPSADLPRESKLELYYFMRLTRSLEERLVNLYRQTKVVGGLFRSLGQEADAVGSALLGRVDSPRFPNRRGSVGRLDVGKAGASRALLGGAHDVPALVEQQEVRLLGMEVRGQPCSRLFAPELQLERAGAARGRNP